jgi:hypothetical protein
MVGEPLVTGPLEYLEAAHKRADEVYTVHDGEHGDMVGDVVAYVRGGGGRDRELANQHLIATHADPAAVLRRITAERKLLEAHQHVADPELGDGCSTCVSDRDGIYLEQMSADEYPCPTVRLLAEAWGWTG